MDIGAIYVRVSTTGQVEDGLGQQAQLDACRGIADEHGLVLPDHHVIVEQASGQFLERDGLDRLRSLVRSKQVSAVIVYDLDRLSRHELGTVIVLDEAHTNDVTVFTRNGPVDSTREGNMIAYIRGYAAGLEKDKIRQRTLDGKRMAAREGVLPVGSGAGLYGYDYTARDRAGKRKQARTINKQEALVVKQMFTLAMEGLEVNTIAVRLNRDGVPTKTGKLWYARTVHNLLTNEAYTGKTSYGKITTKLLAQGKRKLGTRNPDDVIDVEGFTPAIIDQATFDLVQQHLNRPRRSGRALKPYMLSGMLRCTCGTGLVGQSMQRGRFRYYTCRNTSATATRPQSCWAHRTRAENADSTIWSAVSQAVANPAFLYDRAVAQQSLADKPDPQDDRIAIGKRIKKLRDDETKLVAALRAAPNAAESLTKELDGVAGERKRLERTLEPSQPSPTPSSDTISREHIYAFSSAVKERLNTMDAEEQRQLLVLLGFEGIVGDDGRIDASVAVPEASNALFTTGQTWA